MTAGDWAAVIVAIAGLFVALAAIPAGNPHRKGTAIGAAVAVAFAAGIGVGNNLLEVGGSSKSPQLNPAQPPPALSDMAVKWIGSDGRYQVEGHVRNLDVGEMVWTYNQPYAYTTNVPEGIYPDFGPCPVKDDGTFSCKLGYAGNMRDDSGRTFAIYAMIVDNDSAYDASVVKSDLEGREFYPNLTTVPHVQGQSTVAKVEVQHPGFAPQ